MMRFLLKTVQPEIPSQAQDDTALLLDGSHYKRRKAGCLAGLDRVENKNYFFGAIASLVAFATRNFTTVLALIWMGSPVCGLRPMRALR